MTAQEAQLSPDEADQLAARSSPSRRSQACRICGAATSVRTSRPTAGSPGWLSTIPMSSSTGCWTRMENDHVSNACTLRCRDVAGPGRGGERSGYAGQEAPTTPVLRRSARPSRLTRSSRRRAEGRRSGGRGLVSRRSARNQRRDSAGTAGPESVRHQACRCLPTGPGLGDLPRADHVLNPPRDDSPGGVGLSGGGRRHRRDDQAPRRSAARQERRVDGLHPRRRGTARGADECAGRVESVVTS